MVRDYRERFQVALCEILLGVVIESLTPHADFPKIVRGLERARPLASAWSGITYRSTSERYANRADLLSGKGARKTGGRYTPPGAFATVYGSLTPETAMVEVLAHARYYGIAPWKLMRRVFCAVQVQLATLLDLTDGEVRRRLWVSRRRMVEEDWRRSLESGKEALTQAIGRAAFEAGLEGLLVPSAGAARGINLVVFPANLRPDSSLSEIQSGPGSA